MAMKDGHNNKKIVPALLSATYANTATGIIVDTVDFESVEFALTIDSATTLDAGNTFTPQITEGSQANLSDGAAVASADLLNSVTPLPALAAGTFPYALRFGYRGTKRYLRLDLVSKVGSPSFVAHGVCVLEYPGTAPVAGA